MYNRTSVNYIPFLLLTVKLSPPTWWTSCCASCSWCVPVALGSRNICLRSRTFQRKRPLNSEFEFGKSWSVRLFRLGQLGLLGITSFSAPSFQVISTFPVGIPTSGNVPLKLAFLETGNSDFQVQAERTSSLEQLFLVILKTLA